MKKADKNWALGNESLVQFANYFLVHTVKLLCLFVHVIEEREPEHREKVLRRLFLRLLLFLCYCLFLC